MFVEFDMQQFAEEQSCDRSDFRSLSLIQVGLKRVFDIIVSFTALVCLLPLFLVVGCLIKAQSAGPVFYTQTRNGKDGKTFSILKFRSMKHVSTDEFTQCEIKDSRVTAIGKFIRKTSIDELPQLINVLLGQMSIVGPRPHPVELDAKYVGSIPFYMNRYVVKPGLTGLAQIRGLRGLTPDVATMAKRISADLDYAHHVSFFRDFRIILGTIPAIVMPQNAH
jgi:putative colanic acid biosysnthesis UDP-glucose lipid carrier transferase